MFSQFNIKKIFLIIFILLAFIQGAWAQITLEKGDVLFTDGFNIFRVELGHSILYVGWDGEGELNV